MHGTGLLVAMEQWPDSLGLVSPVRGYGASIGDLPPDRAEIAPLFTIISFEVFGPWVLETRRIRGGAALNKCWGLVLTCLVIRAVHMEL